MNRQTLLNRFSRYLVLIRYLNCALATFATLQKARRERDHDLLKAVNGLEGGCAACGLTCGIATGGSLGVGMANEDLLRRGVKGEMAVVEAAGDYMEWFRETHGSSLCRDRTGVDFHTVSGQLSYLFPGNKVVGCMAMTGRSLNHLINDHTFTAARSGAEKISPEVRGIRHCARYVLERIRMKTGVGNRRLERLAVVFDGGVGLKGEVCGAFAGAVMGINLAGGYDIRSFGFPGNLGRFIRGHISLVRKADRNKKEVFARGKQLAIEFRNRFGSIRCSELCGVTFRNSREFICHMTGSSTCHEIMDFAAGQTVRLLNIN